MWDRPPDGGRHPGCIGGAGAGTRPIADAVPKNPAERPGGPQAAPLAGRQLAPFRGDHHHRRAQQPSVQGPGRRPGLHHGAGGAHGAPAARPSPGAGSGRRAGPGRPRAGCRCAPAGRRSCARPPRSPRAAWSRSLARRPPAPGRLSRPRRRFSAASTTSSANFWIAYWRASSTSRWVRWRRFCISASARIQRSRNCATSASSAAMRSSGVASAAGAALSWAAVTSFAAGFTGGISAGSLISIDLILGGPRGGGPVARSGSPCRGQRQPVAAQTGRRGVPGIHPGAKRATAGPAPPGPRAPPHPPGCRRRASAGPRRHAPWRCGRRG